MERFEIMTNKWGGTDWMVDEALTSPYLKTMQNAVNAIETTRVYPTHVILVRDDSGMFVGYALLNLDLPNDAVLAAEVGDGYEDSGVLEGLKERSDALLWLKKAQLRMARNQ